jgi:hypothetical protein
MSTTLSGVAQSTSRSRFSVSLLAAAAAQRKHSSPEGFSSERM